MSELENAKEKYKNYSKLMYKWKDDCKTNGVYKNDEKAQKNVFIVDGIVCPKEWFKQEIRPLFVLKEAYCQNNSKNEIDETEWINGTYTESIKNSTFKRLIDWARIIFDDSSDGGYNWNNEIFKNIALINIKKYGGQSYSDNEDLKKHAIQHADFIFEQIELIYPTIIICGYTGWLLDEVWKKKGMGNARLKGTGRVYEVLINGRSVSLVDFWHPACRTNHLAEFRSDIKAIKEKTEAIGKAPYQPPKDDDSENESKDTF